MKKILSFYLYKENRREKSYNNISSIYNNDTYTMILDDVKTIFSKDFLIRENNEFKFYLDIKNKKALYLLKDKNIELEIIVEKIDIQKENNKITLNYKLESDSENTKIVIIEEDE